MQVDGYEDDLVRISVADNPHPDRFAISFDRNRHELTVRRVDSDEGWGQNLMLNLVEKSTGRKRTLCVGPSATNGASVSTATNRKIPRAIISSIERM